ncbi:MAG: class I SAM-dependent methyltransferase, partial [Erysipelotrichaceae bacterium]
MKEDEKRYTDTRAELIRTNKQGNSNNLHDNVALDGLDWSLLEQLGKIIILDLRCGDGKSTVERFSKYLDKAEVVVGVDSSQEKIEIAKKTYKDLTKFDFFCLDLDSPFLQAQLKGILKKYNATHFSIIFGAYILIHLDDPQRLIKRLHKLTIGGGYILFQEPDDSGKICYPNEEVLKTIIDCFDALPWIEDRFFAKKIPKMLSDAGYKNIECLYNTIDTLNKSVEDRKKIFDITFSHRYSGYDCVSEQELADNAVTAKKLDEALDKIKAL